MGEETWIKSFQVLSYVQIQYVSGAIRCIEIDLVLYCPELLINEKPPSTRNGWKGGRAEGRNGGGEKAGFGVEWVNKIMPCHKDDTDTPPSHSHKYLCRLTTSTYHTS